MTDAAAEVATDVATIYNRTMSRLELADGSMLGVEGKREDFVVTDYERGLEASGMLTLVRADDEPLPVPPAPEPDDESGDDPATGGDGS